MKMIDEKGAYHAPGASLAPQQDARRASQQELAQISFDNEILTERMAELELALEDANWMRMTFTGQQEFSREGLKKIREISRMMFAKNPLIKRGVMVKALYVWGQGINVRAKDKAINQVLQTFWDDEKNRSELTSHQARMLKEIDLEVEGLLYFVFFTRPTDGRVRVRTLPADEVVDVISNPQDAKTPWYYVRAWMENKFNPRTGSKETVTRKAYYPDWRYHPKARPQKIGGIPVQWDSPVYFVRTGKFGESEVYAAIDWARAYKEFLEDVASLMRAYSRFAWKRITKGKKAIAAEKAKLASTLASGDSSETNPPPVTGAMALLGEGTDLQPMQVRGASISPEDGRRLLLMVAAAVNLPETYFGDVSVGTLATARSMDRPTELAMKERQMLWTDILRDIFRFVILQAVKATNGELRKMAAIEIVDDGEETEERITWNEGANLQMDIDFPPILEQDVQAGVQAVITALTLNGQELRLLDDQIATRLILKAMGEDDVDEIMSELFPDETTSVANETASDVRMKTAARKLAEAILEAKQSGVLEAVEGQTRADPGRIQGGARADAIRPNGGAE